MPGGKTHYKAWRKMWVLPFGLVLYLAFFQVDLGRIETWFFLLSILPGYYLGSFIDPDLDIRNSTYEVESKKRWPMILKPLVGLYSEIAYYMGGHRSLLTHIPVISTIIRFVILLLMPVLIFSFLLGQLVGLDIGVWWQVWLDGFTIQVLAGTFIGLCLSDTVHFLLDVFA